MRLGTRLGVDVGSVRVGVARSDPDGILATPVETVPRGGEPIGRIAELAGELDAIEVLVGLPTSLGGRSTASTADAEGFAQELAAAVPVPVRLVDERLTTVSAQSALRAAGRSSRKSRPVIDQVAAVIIVQDALDYERGTGAPAGRLVVPDEGQR